jgi:hypothetical protein
MYFFKFQISSPASATASVKEINQELEEYARKYEAIQRHRRSANSPLTAAPTADRHRLWSRQDSTESSRSSTGRGSEGAGGNREDLERSTAAAQMISSQNSYTNGELLSGECHGPLKIFRNVFSRV